MQTNTKRSIGAIIAIIVFLLIAVKTCQSILSLSDLKTKKEISELDSISYLRHCPKDYLDLFLNRGKIFCDSSIKSKHRNLVTEFHDEKYYLQVCKLDTFNVLSLNNIIHEVYNNSDISMYSYYADASTNKQLRIRYKLGPKPKIASVWFTLFGFNTQVLKKNDTVAYYYSNFKNFSVRYQKEGKIDVYGRVKDNLKNSNLPIEVMFLKRNENLYILFLTNKNYSSILDPYALYNLIIKSK